MGKAKENSYDLATEEKKKKIKDLLCKSIPKTMTNEDVQILIKNKSYFLKELRRIFDNIIGESY